jgi:hypothetical protein
MRAYRPLRCTPKEADRDKFDDPVLRALTPTQLRRGMSAAEFAELPPLTSKAVARCWPSVCDAGLKSALCDKARPGAAALLEDGQRSAQSL